MSNNASKPDKDDNRLDVYHGTARDDRYQGGKTINVRSKDDSSESYTFAVTDKDGKIQVLESELPNGAKYDWINEEYIKDPPESKGWLSKLLGL